MRGLQAFQQLRRPPSDVEVHTVAAGVSVRLHQPPEKAEPTSALLWMHGGGYVIGSAQHDDELCRRFARTLGITVAAVDYRLAPKHPFPAPLDDCYAALVWLARLPGVDASRVAIGGASGGGGLTAALALRARERGEAATFRQLLAYPMLDDRTTTKSGLDSPDHRLWNQAANRFGWASYLGGADPNVAVPARCDDLSGLPPAWIGVGTLDLFHNEDLAYAERLNEAGVPCEVEVIPGAFHGFDQVAPKAQVSQRFFASQCAYLQEAFAPR